jgi:peptidoglycan/LPS O-acetylase OafA/YrhL
MNKAFSIYLDLLRAVAAGLVYLTHSKIAPLVAGTVPGSGYGHSAVIVFFVLSGFVIAWVADTRERVWTDFAASRLARIYSVVLAAVPLTLALDAAGRVLYPALYIYPFDRFFLRTAGSLAMVNEVWFVSMMSFSNLPYWSVAYECWYYLLFGALSFLSGRARWVAVALVLAVMGPKMLLLWPAWGAGVLLYRWRRLADLSPQAGLGLTLLSLVGIVAYHRYGVGNAIGDALAAALGHARFERLAFSGWFIGDWLLAALVFCHFAGMRQLAPHGLPGLLRIEKPVRTLAAYSLTLYLLHQPVLLFWTAAIQGDPQGYGFWWSVTALTALTIAVVGRHTENKRHTLRLALLRALPLLQASARNAASGGRKTHP